MRFLFLLVSVVGGPSPASEQVSHAPEYSDHSVLLVYRDDAGGEHAVQTSDEWAARRKHIVAGMEAAMGPCPDRSKLPALDMQVTETVVENGYRRVRISFLTEQNDRVSAYLLMPSESVGGPRWPAMLALHQTIGIGKGEVVGLGGSPNLHYGRELAQRGYVVLAPDYPSFGDYPYDFQDSRYVSGSMKGIFNHLRAVDLLQSLPQVDGQRIGVIGHSLGGHNAMFAGVFDERLKVVVASCGWTPFHDYYDGKIAGWTSDRYMPRLRTAYALDPDRVPFDFYEVVAALAPRGFFSNSPTGDGNFAVAGVRKGEAKAREVFSLLGAADRLQIRYPECGHDFPADVRREAYAFIDRVLAHVPARQVP
jgi:pimeloyl-ACP methyl ester carboxylesterase